MISSRLRRTAAVAALVTASSTLVAGGALGAEPRTVHRLDTSLSIRVASPRVGLDGRDRVIGRLVSHHVGLRHKRVALLSKADGASAWSFRRVRLTHARGRVGFTVSPNVPTSFRLVFFGSRNFQPARSAAVDVATRPTALSISATPGTIDRGDSAMVSGVLTNDGAPYAGQTVELRAKRVGSHDSFSTIGSGTTAADGSVAFTVTPQRSTRYVLFLPHTTGVVAARSAVATVWVRWPTSLSIRGKATSDGRFVVSGDLRGHGMGLAHRRVTLQQEAVGATTWTDVRTKLTGPRGWVRFARALVSGTSYRLSYAGGPRFTGCMSGTVVS